MRTPWLHLSALIAVVSPVAPTPIAAQEVTPERTVGAWHPFLGILEQETTVTTGEATEISFEFTAGS